MSKWICDRCGIETGDGILLMPNNRLCWPCHNKSGRARQSTDTTIRQSVHGETCYEWDCSSCGQGITSTSPEFAGRRCAKCDNKKPLNAHYKHGSIDPCQYVEAMGDAEYRGACILNILKYITRYPHKGTPMEDLMKAQDYVNMLIEHQRKKESKS